jgi:hypothetical protein
MQRKKWHQLLVQLEYVEQNLKPNWNIMLQKGSITRCHSTLNWLKLTMKSLEWNPRLDVQKNWAGSTMSYKITTANFIINRPITPKTIRQRAYNLL